ncbi:MAG: M23 family metallopeptidase, partial [Proteobacteria bacterium]
YEHLPRTPDRPADYELYRYPVPPGLPGRSVVSGYDLDLPDDKQRRGISLRHVGHGGIDLPQVRGTPVHVVTLEHQEGDADVLFAGEVFGRSVLLRQRLRQGAGDLREYVTLFGHLESTAPGLVRGMTVHEGDVIGAVGDSGSPGLVHLHFEIRRVRDGLDAETVLKDKGPGALFSSASSVPVDPRNLLPFR